MEKHRIEWLDSFRFLAIGSVMLYHFTNSWIPLYPYGNFFRHIFRNGYLGVHFFFMISGCVISYTLERTSGIRSFFLNRFSRLFPPMLLCSLITFLFIRIFDTQWIFPNAHPVKNFLPGLTFITPAIWNQFTKMHFAWLNGSYWSLWVEVQFYMIAATLYFLNKRYFFRNILLAGIVISAVKFIPMYFNHFQQPLLQSHGWTGFFDRWKYLHEVFNIDFFMLWFLSGVIFHQLYKGYRLTQNIFTGVCAGIIFIFLLLEIRIFPRNSFYSMLLSWLVMHALFLLMIYREKYFRFFRNGLIERIGMISYGIYLIHEDIGVLLIQKYGGLLGSASFLSPFIVMILLTGFAAWSYRFYERKAALLIKKMFGGRGEKPPAF